MDFLSRWAIQKGVWGMVPHELVGDSWIYHLVMTFTVCHGKIHHATFKNGVYHLFRLGPSQNHGKLLVITRLGIYHRHPTYSNIQEIDKSRRPLGSPEAPGPPHQLFFLFRTPPKGWNGEDAVDDDVNVAQLLPWKVSCWEVFRMERFWFQYLRKGIGCWSIH